MEYLLAAIRSNLAEYLTTYSDSIKDEIANLLANFNKIVVNVNNSKQKPTKITENWINCCKEVESWKKYYSATLFDSYISEDFIIFTNDQLIRMVKQLKNDVDKSSISNSKDIQKIISLNQTAMKISKLGDLWGDAPKIANAICKNYEKEVAKKINNKKVVKHIQEKDYRNAYRAMNELLGNIDIMKSGNQNNGEIMQDTKLAVYNSIDQLIVNMENETLTLSLEGFDSSESTVNRVIQLCKEVKMLASAKSFFFSKEENKNFLGEYADEFHREIKKIENNLSRWAKDALPKVSNDIAANQFMKAKKQLNILLQTGKKIQAAKLLDSKIIDNTIQEIEKLIRNKIDQIKQAFSFNNNIENHNINPFSGLDFIHEQLIKAGETKAAEEIRNKANNYYQKYLNDINNNQMNDLDEQSSMLKLAGQMLSSMPDLLKKQLESHYNIIKIQVSKNLDNRNIDVEKIKKNMTPQEDINSWHKHKNKAKTSLAYMEVRNNIKKRSQEIYNKFKLSLSAGKLDKASEHFQKLTLYKEHLDKKKFDSVHNTYQKAVSSKVEYGNHLLDQLDNATENLNEVPEVLDDIVFKMRYFIKYKEALL